MPHQLGGDLARAGAGNTAYETLPMTLPLCQSLSPSRSDCNDPLLRSSAWPLHALSDKSFLPFGIASLSHKVTNTPQCFSPDVNHPYNILQNTETFHLRRLAFAFPHPTL